MKTIKLENMRISEMGLAREMLSKYFRTGKQDLRSFHHGHWKYFHIHEAATQIVLRKI